ncbi:MAG: class I SAM-dependent methyltransferase [Clostridia bacterium]
MNYVDIICAIVNSTNCKLYLELGCQHATTVRKMIAQNRKVIGVDIRKQFDQGDFFFFYEETTDNFFTHFNEHPDIIYIDADHNFESVKKDFINSLKVLNAGGTILIHDTDPNEAKLLDPQYCNDSYKIVDWIKENYKDLDVLVLPADEPGLTLVRRSKDRRVLNFV